MPVRRSALFSWLNEWSQSEKYGVLEQIFIASGKAEPMQSVTQIRVLREGLEGDRYATGRGHWIKTDNCPVTLSRAEDLKGRRSDPPGKVGDRAGGRFANGEHRRNLVVSGIPIQAYRGRHLRIGEVLFRYQRPRPPCGYLERLLWRGAAKSLGKGAGIGLTVVEPGVIRVGDRAELIDSE